MTTSDMLKILKLKFRSDKDLSTNDPVLLMMLNRAQDTIISLLNRHLLNDLDGKSLNQTLDGEGAYDISNLGIFGGIRGIDAVRMVSDEKYSFLISYDQYIDHSNKLRQFFSNKPRHYVRSNKIYPLFPNSTEDVPSGNIVANSVYKVIDYGKIWYNSVGYATNAVFTGISGVTGYGTTFTPTLGDQVNFVETGGNDDYIVGSNIDIDWSGISAGDTITVSGSVNNNGSYSVTNIANYKLYVPPGSLVNEIDVSATIVASLAPSTGKVILATYIDLYYLKKPTALTDSNTSDLDPLLHDALLDLAEAEGWNILGNEINSQKAMNKALAMINEYNTNYKPTESESYEEAWEPPLDSGLGHTVKFDNT